MTDREPTAIEALRKRVVDAVSAWVVMGNALNRLAARMITQSVLSAIGIPEQSLAWAANNPETLAALASGEMVAVPLKWTDDMVEAFKGECAGDADEPSYRRVRQAWREAYRALAVAALPDPTQQTIHRWR